MNPGRKVIPFWEEKCCPLLIVGGSIRDFTRKKEKI